MLDVVKDLKFFPPPDMVTKWQVEGKLGKQGMKEDLFMPVEYEDYKDILQVCM
jgi:hypothetical protein